MRNIFIVLLLAMGLTALAQVPPPPAASQAEVNAGTATRKYVSPATLNAWDGGITNGIAVNFGTGNSNTLNNPTINGGTVNATTLNATNVNLQGVTNNNGTYTGINTYMGTNDFSATTIKGITLPLTTTNTLWLSASTGNDSSAVRGTVHAWQTLPALLSRLQQGDIVRILDGTFNQDTSGTVFLTNNSVYGYNRATIEYVTNAVTSALIQITGNMDSETNDGGPIYGQCILDGLNIIVNTNTTAAFIQNPITVASMGSAHSNYLSAVIRNNYIQGASDGYHELNLSRAFVNGDIHGNTIVSWWDVIVIQHSLGASAGSYYHIYNNDCYLSQIYQNPTYSSSTESSQRAIAVTGCGADIENNRIHIASTLTNNVQGIVPAVTVGSTYFINLVGNTFTYDPNNQATNVQWIVAGVTDTNVVCWSPIYNPQDPVSVYYDGTWAQAGTTNVSAATSVVVQMKQMFTSTNYSVMLQSDNGSAVLGSPYVSTKTPTNFTANFSSFTGNVDWHTQLQTQ